MECKSPRVFVDLGSYQGDMVRRYHRLHPLDYAWCWEPNPNITPDPGIPHKVIRACAWVRNGYRPFFLSGTNIGLTGQGSTLYREKTTGWLDYAHPVRVPVLDFAEWMRSHRHDYLVLKANIEGSEYALISHLYGEGVLDLAQEIHISWHDEKMEGWSPKATEERKELLSDMRFVQRTSILPGLEFWGQV